MGEDQQRCLIPSPLTSDRSWQPSNPPLAYPNLVRYELGTAPTQEQSILGVLFRAIYSHIIVIIQLLLRGGSTQPMKSENRGR